MTKILIYSEHIQDKTQEKVIKAYPDGIHAALGGIFSASEYVVRYSFLENIEETITPEILADTDVMLWWGHVGHNDVPDGIAKMVAAEVHKGMGFIPLHSAHESKPVVRLLGTSCTLKWRDDDRERLWTAAPYHPIAKDIPEHFELEQEEMYGEPFDIPNAEDIVFMGWFAGGEVFRSGVTFRRGAGRIFYFQPGHEEYPNYYNELIRKIITNAVKWATPDYRRQKLNCPNPKPLETQL